MQSLIDVKSLAGTLAGDIATELFAARAAHRRVLGQYVEALQKRQELEAENARLRDLVTRQKAALNESANDRQALFRELVQALKENDRL